MGGVVGDFGGRSIADAPKDGSAFFRDSAVIAALVLLASYFIHGEDQTNDAIRKSAGQSSEIINQHLGQAEPKGS